MEGRRKGEGVRQKNGGHKKLAGSGEGDGRLLVGFAGLNHEDSKTLRLMGFARLTANFAN